MEEIYPRLPSGRKKNCGLEKESLIIELNMLKYFRLSLCLPTVSVIHKLHCL